MLNHKKIILLALIGASLGKVEAEPFSLFTNLKESFRDTLKTLYDNSKTGWYVATGIAFFSVLTGSWYKKKRDLKKAKIEQSLKECSDQLSLMKKKYNALDEILKEQLQELQEFKSNYEKNMQTLQKENNNRVRKSKEKMRKLKEENTGLLSIIRQFQKKDVNGRSCIIHSEHFQIASDEAAQKIREKNNENYIFYRGRRIPSIRAIHSDLVVDFIQKKKQIDHEIEELEKQEELEKLYLSNDIAQECKNNLDKKLFVGNPKKDNFVKKYPGSI